MVAKNIIFARQSRNQGSLSAGPQALILGILAWLGISLPSVALEVTARLDDSVIRLGESVRLILVADAQFENGPDLSPLQRDFQITGRSSARQITEINGQRQEHHELRLVLAPLRAGHLEIPAIAFGEVKTHPLTLAVTESAINPALVTWAPTNDQACFTPFPPISGDYPAPRDTASNLGPGTGAAPPTPTMPQSVNPAQSLTTEHLSKHKGNIDTQNASDWPWDVSLYQLGTWSGSGFWILAGMVPLVLLVLGWWLSGQLRVSQPTSEISPPPRPDPHEPQASTGDPITAAIMKVRSGYESGEATAARQALLTWATLVLPNNPPSNLAQLAKCCREPLRGEVLMLEQAFFSPHPLDWSRQRVWESLSSFDPLPAELPVSFRQKRPIRRPSAAR